MLPDWVKVQLEMAAKGCVSGTLSEWPLLRKAFVFCGWMPRGEAMTASDMRSLAKLCLKELSDDS